MTDHENNVPQTGQQHDNPELNAQFAFQFTQRDVVDMRISELTDDIADKRREAESRLSEANKKLTGDRELLAEKAKETLSYHDRNDHPDIAAAQSLAEALNAFHGEDAAGTRERTIRTNVDECDIDTQIIRVEITVGPREALDRGVDRNRYYHSYDHEAVKNIDIPFTDEMKEIVARIEAGTLEVNAIHQELHDLKRDQANIPREVKRTAAQLTRRALEGRLTRGRDALETTDKLEQLPLHQPTAIVRPIEIVEDENKD